MTGGTRQAEANAPIGADKASWRSRIPWYAIAPAALMLVLGMRGLNSVGYWVDEFYTLNAVKGGLGETLGELPYLPYYTVVWAATGGGACLTESCLRYPSVLAMVGAVAAVAVTARILTNRRGGLAAGLLMVMAPGIQRFAQEARPYALGVLLVSLATLMLVLACRRSIIWPWIAYSTTIVAVGLVLPVGLVVLLAHGALMMLNSPWRIRVKPWLLSIAAASPVFILDVWWLISSDGARSASTDPFVIHLQNLTEALAWPVSGLTNGGALAGAFAMALVILALWSRGGVAWLASFCVSVGAVWVASLGPATWWQARTLLPLAGLLVVGAAVTLAGSGRWRYLAVLAILGLITAPFYTSNRLPWSRGYDYRQAAMITNDRWVAGDRVDPGNNLPWIVQWSLDHYTPDGSRFADDSTPSSGRSWQWGGADACNAVESWDLGIGNTLRLCDASSVEAAGDR